MQLVLIVEDDVLFRATMARALGKLPLIEVIEAGGVAEAWQLICSLPVDLVIADIELRDGTVLEILPLLAERRTPIVMVSGHVEEFAERLPSGVEVHAKPLSPQKLCQIVTGRLGFGGTRAPFSLADYVQLAALGKHSIALEVSRAGESVGSVVVSKGEAWSAWDEIGAGVDAFLRMMSLTELEISCAAAPNNPGPRNLTGTVQHLLMDAARMLDELGASQPPRPVPARPPVRPALRTAPPPLPPIPSRPPEGTNVTRRDPREDEFDRLYALGIDALLAKRYGDAFDTLYRASQIRTTASLDANLKRLREMGFK